MTNEELKKQLESDKLFRKDGGLNTAWIHNRAKNYDLDYLEGDTLQEKLYLLYHDRVYCSVCGKATPFVNWSYGYTTVCSRECKKEFDRQTLRTKAVPKVQTEETKQKRKKTCLEKYGAENVFGAKHIKDRIKQTNIEKYGVEHPAQNQEVLHKMEETNKRNHNGLWNTQTEEHQEQCRKTSLLKYGVDHPHKSEVIKKKKIETNLKKYGVEVPSQSNFIKEKVRKANIAKYGVDYPMQISEIRNRALSKREMTIPEKKFSEFLANRGFIYKRNYTLSNETTSKNYDFVVFDNDKPIIAVEIDGKFYHGLLSDCDGGHVRGEADNSRFSILPKDCKLLVIDKDKIEDGIRAFLRIVNIDYDLWIKEIVDSLPKDFPYYNYSESRLRKDFENLCRYEDVSVRGRLADSTIKHFHKSIYHAHVSLKPSPYEAWSNKELLEKCVKNRFIYSCSLSGHSVLGGFNVCRLAPKVSVFSASMAKYLIRKYLNDFDEIFDPFSGFSGRLLGTVACNKKYIGQDINADHVRESNEIIKFHNLQNTSVIQKNVLDSSGFYDCMFTCPPYGGKEHWNIKNDLIEKSCDEWIDECLSRFDCKRYVFVVDATEKYKDCIKEEIYNNGVFGSNYEKVVIIDK